VSHKTILLIASEAVSSTRPRCFDRAPSGDEVLRVSSVPEALNYLQAAAPSTNCSGYPFPALVLIWSTEGGEALSKLQAWMRHEALLTQIPIVVLKSVAGDSQAGSALESSSKNYLVSIGDTDTLLDVVSKHWPGNRSLTRTAEAH
jgi:CheY-like chemotaxis protein